MAYDALERGEYELSVELFTKVMKMFEDPDIPVDNSGIQTSRAFVYIKQRQFNKALEDCHNVLERFP